MLAVRHRLPAPSSHWMIDIRLAMRIGRMETPPMVVYVADDYIVSRYTGDSNVIEALANRDMTLQQTISIPYATHYAVVKLLAYRSCFHCCPLEAIADQMEKALGTTSIASTIV